MKNQTTVSCAESAALLGTCDATGVRESTRVRAPTRYGKVYTKTKVRLDDRGQAGGCAAPPSTLLPRPPPSTKPAPTSVRSPRRAFSPPSSSLYVPFWRPTPPTPAKTPSRRPPRRASLRRWRCCARRARRRPASTTSTRSRSARSAGSSPSRRARRPARARSPDEPATHACRL